MVDNVVGIAEMRSHLKEFLDRVAKGMRYIVVQRSKARAVLLSPEEVETLEVMADKGLLSELIEAKADIRAGRYRTFGAYFKKHRGRRASSN